jgi:hypothetical protein
MTDLTFSLLCIVAIAFFVGFFVALSKERRGHHSVTRRLSSGRGSRAT